MSHPARLAIVLLTAAFFAFGWRYDLALVSGDSMQPTYSTGDLLLVDTWAYGEAGPHRGDILVARHGKEWIVKRVVGLPREWVQIEDGLLLVNRSPMPEPYSIRPGPLVIAPGWLREGRYAVVGDNRNVFVEECIHRVLGLSDMKGRVVAALPFGFLARLVFESGGENS